MNYRIILFLAMLAALFSIPRLGASFDSCDGYEAAIVVDTSNHTMLMCRDNQSQGFYRVALGRGGVGKQAKGDGKTPIGDYGLSPPRYSAQYRLFIPVGYPDDGQKSKGFSGGNIGIHGPHRKFLWLGKDSAEADWTSGCIAVGTDEEVMKVGEWVNEQNITRIVIQ
jgi:murein L,D-transpeptidase YafK